MKYYIIAGEASGDLLGSYLMAEIKRNDPEADFLVWGGDLMEAQGGEVIKHYKELAFMGFWEVLVNLRTILKNFSICKVDMLLYEPDVVIFIDYPGFNLKMAKFARENGFKVVHYVSPSVWAWKKKRVFQIKRDVDLLLSILPFEKVFYARYQYDVAYIGHPLLDVIQDKTPQMASLADFKQQYQLDKRPIIALIPGSRKQELNHILPIMVSIIDQFPEYQFVISKVAWQPLSLYQKLIGNRDIKLVEGDTYPLIHHAEAALVTSGTATLETALLNTPQVVCYKGNAISYSIAKRVVGKDLKFISLVNLILDQPVVTELIQHDLNPDRLVKELKLILKNGEKREGMLEQYRELKTKLGSGGASQKGAELIDQLVKKGK
ncbi:MAG TPA: lipid-A-disaccharide synthase [Bacteroidales bacterium]|mgnify:FL=1|nr:lipid-A-disaccharide synthase [Bacteroidales bacterium]HOH22796.1 lipid-A-disaccharide synthase [Bacteroidales bacterium]HPZ04127.1 lipid-A-disaccharide synthase [Bacteroidales bacterium]HQB75207.1 lipid-A-disaccharide synthase [Bacteroidales bacterium]